MSGNPLEILPAPARAALEQFARRAEETLGAGLSALILYGGVAKGRYGGGASNVNVLAVLREDPLEALDHLGAALAVARREMDLQLMTLVESDLPNCVEVFATKFLDIQRHHWVLCGRDVVAPLAIARERLVRQARREIVNAELRVRQAYLERAGRTEMLETVLERAEKTVRLNLAVLELPACFPELPNEALEQRCASFLKGVETCLQALGPA